MNWKISSLSFILENKLLIFVYFQSAHYNLTCIDDWLSFVKSHPFLMKNYCNVLNAMGIGFEGKGSLCYIHLLPTNCSGISPTQTLFQPYMLVLRWLERYLSLKQHHLHPPNSFPFVSLLFLITLFCPND